MSRSDNAIRGLPGYHVDANTVREPVGIMEFKKQAPRKSEGAILAHSLPLKDRRLRKGKKLDADDVMALEAGDYTSVTVAIPEEDDISEDDAAFALANAITGDLVRADSPVMGRSNIWSDDFGLLVLDEAALNEINQVHESLTIATLKPYSVVTRSQMIATVKVIPYAVRRDIMQECLHRAASGHDIVQVRPFAPHAIGLVQTSIGKPKEGLLDKTRKVLSQRLRNLNSHIACEIRCGHDEADVLAALGDIKANGIDMIILSGASAVVDRRDILPAAIIAAGGNLVHYGMPVDPGNLLLLAEIDALPVVGMPGCARSPKFNGFDMILERLIAKIPVSANDIMKMGVGGLLSEIDARPQPRVSGVAVKKARKIAAIVLAAGESKRMGAENKLLVEFHGQPMIEHTVQNISSPLIDAILVVIGKDGNAIKSILGKYDLEYVENINYADGLSSSIICGLNQLDDGTEAALMVLGDMPMIPSTCLERLISAFDPGSGREICVPVYQGKRGNPVLWSRRFFHEMMQLEGDHGAKQLLYKYEDFVKEVQMPDAGVLLDFDTRASLEDFKLP